MRREADGGSQAAHLACEKRASENCGEAGKQGPGQPRALQVSSEAEEHVGRMEGGHCHLDLHFFNLTPSFPSSLLGKIHIE